LSRTLKIHTLLSVFVLITYTGTVFAQNKHTGIWLLKNMKLDFNTEPVTVSNIVLPSGSRATIANSEGQLLFAYTDVIRDKNLQTLLNGTVSYSERPMFIPMPGNERFYYLFGNYKYSLIDTTLNSGNGDVIEKDIEYNTINIKEIQAVHHANCRDIWILGVNDTAYIAYLLTPSGISNSPIITTRLPTGATTGGNYSIFSVSPSGSLFVICHSIDSGTQLIAISAEFGTFDRNTGSFSRSQLYQSFDYSSAYKCAFSPDNSKIYFAATSKIINGSQHQIIQVNIVNGVADFANLDIVSATAYTGFQPFGFFQLARDGKIYETLGRKWINVINNPNVLGSACNYQQNAIPTASTQQVLPNFISTWFSTNYCELDFFSVNYCQTDNTQFYINNTDNIATVIWNFGDSQTSTELNPTHTYANASTYTVTLEVTFTDNSTQTIMKTIEIFDKPSIILIEHE